MPLQNRVTPFGEIVAIPQRGMFTGNRGIIHDPATRTLMKRRWASKAWLVCVCEYKDCKDCLKLFQPSGMGTDWRVRRVEHSDLELSIGVLCLNSAHPSRVAFRSFRSTFHEAKV